MAIQIIEENRKPSFGQQFTEALGQGLNLYGEYKKGRSQIEAAKRLGVDPSILQLPQEAQKEYFKNQFAAPRKDKEMADKFLAESRDYDIVNQTFGKKFADVWKASPVGGKTELLKYGMDALSRGENLENLLEDIDVPQENSISTSLNENIPQMKNGKISKDFQWPDYSKRPFGYNPKEWANEKKSWRKENAPIFQENKTHLNSLQKDSLAIKNLQKLSPKLPEGVERLIINPETGEPYGIAQLAGVVSPEVQEWVKEVSRFQNRAKDTFGSRVTNFDLVSYMKQFPGLLNTEEGRRRILRMMGINNQLDNLYETALNQVYKKYGLSEIPQEKADELATNFIKDDAEKLREEYLQIDQENQQMDSQANKTVLSGRTVDVLGPDGQLYEIDESEVDQLPEGYRVQ